MEYRKIQVTGESTYIVSIPKNWVKKNGLEKGDIVYLMERGDELMLKLKEEKEKETEVKIKTSDVEFLARLLITKYIQGYDSVVFSSKDYMDPKIRSHLIKVSAYLIGMEPFGETKDSITFRMFMKDARNLMESVERMHDISMLSLRELLEELESDTFNENILNGIIQRDEEIDKFYFLILRQLSSMSGFEAMIWAQIAKNMERLSDHIENIAVLMKEKKKIKKEDVELFRQLVDLYGDVMLTLKNVDLSMAEEVLINVEKFREAKKKVMDNLDAAGRKNILAYTSFGRIGEYISDIGESVINLS
ncbi:MAG: phosphate uptake regulator PhoU [Candidatus Altiarchaeota archaeon]|nr:phosphate uptake regulator PhoU [Candidatus Altiarchaeota archaeon]